MDEQVIPILRVANAADAVAWYERLGFSQEWEHRFEPDCPAFVSIARGRARLYLSEHRGDARPDTLVHLFVSDIDSIVAEFGRPADEPPYGCEIELRDPDGNRVRISTAKPRRPPSSECRAATLATDASLAVTAPDLHVGLRPVPVA